MNMSKAETEDGETLSEVGGSILNALITSSSSIQRYVKQHLVVRPSTPIADDDDDDDIGKMTNTAARDLVLCDYLDKRYRTWDELVNHAELITRDVYIGRCREAKLLALIDPDHLTKRGLLKFLFLQSALLETSTNNNNVEILAEDLTDEGIRAVANGKAKWISARLTPTFSQTSTDILTLLQARQEVTDAFIRTAKLSPQSTTAVTSSLQSVSKGVSQPTNPTDPMDVSTKRFSSSGGDSCEVLTKITKYLISDYYAYTVNRKRPNTNTNTNTFK